MSRKLQHVSLNLKDKEMIKRIFILMQLKNIPSPGTSKQGQGVTEWVRDQTNMGRLCEEKKWRIWCSFQISPEDVHFPQPIIPAPHNPSPTPKCPTFGIVSSALEGGWPGENWKVADGRCIPVSHRQRWTLVWTVPGLMLAATQTITPASELVWSSAPEKTKFSSLPKFQLLSFHKQLLASFPSNPSKHFDYKIENMEIESKH